MTQDEIARTICCPGGVCVRPERCFASALGEQTLVDVRTAARAVHELLCRRWREWPRNSGPMSVTVTYGGGDDT